MNTPSALKFALTLLLVCLFAEPGAAQQAKASSDFVVPDNLAPHAAPEQPLPFSHKAHMAMGLVCEMCHTNPEPGSLMTYPGTDTCMSCHAAIATDTAAIRSLHALAESGHEIPWVRVYAVTPGVTWAHKPHVDAGVQCETCHGAISQADVVSETKATVAMATCIGCHAARGAKTECVTCHAWPTDEFLGIK